MDYFPVAVQCFSNFGGEFGGKFEGVVIVIAFDGLNNP